MHRASLWVAMGTVTLVFVGMAGWGVKGEWTAEAATRTVVAPLTGYAMPPFTLRHYPSGQLVSTATLLGKPLFIQFWTSWCTFCKAEMPDLTKAYQRYGRTVEFLSVNVTSEDSLPDVKAFRRQYGMTWPIALDASGDVAQTYRIIGIPTAFFVNRQGVIMALKIGAMTAKDLNRGLDMIARS